MGMAVDGISTDRILGGQLCGTAPVHECLLDLLAFRVGADRAVVLVPAFADGLLFTPRHQSVSSALGHFGPPKVPRRRGSSSAASAQICRLECAKLCSESCSISAASAAL